MTTDYCLTRGFHVVINNECSHDLLCTFIKVYAMIVHSACHSSAGCPPIAQSSPHWIVGRSQVSAHEVGQEHVPMSVLECSDRPQVILTDHLRVLGSQVASRINTQ